MIGEIAGLAMGAIGGIFGGIKASQAAKKARAGVLDMQRENEDWYNRRYNEDATQRADAQNALRRAEEAYRQRNAAAQGTAAVMGTTGAAAAAEKQANSAAMAEAAAQVVEGGERRKDAIESEYLRKKENYKQQLNQIEMGKAQAISQAAQGVASAGAQFASLF